MKILPLNKWSLAARMTVWYAISSFALILIATGLLYHALSVGLSNEEDVLLSQNIQTLRSLLVKPPDEMDEFRQELVLEHSSGRPVLVWLRILDGEGKMIAETSGMSQAMPATLFPKAIKADQEAFKGKAVDFGTGGTFRVLSVQDTWLGHKSLTAFLQVGLDQNQRKNILSKFRKRLWLILGFSFFVCMVAGYWIAHRGIRPVKKMARTVTRIRSTTLHERLMTDGIPPELSELAVTFNEMMDRLENSFARLSRFSADMAHELRTPIQNLKGETEVVLRKSRTQEEYRELLGSCMEEYQRLSILIDRLLFLARAENATITLQKEEVNLSTEINLIKDYCELSAGEAGLNIEFSVPADLELSVDRALFQRAVGNLVENSIKHTPRSGIIRLKAFQEDRNIKIEVSDTGRGIPADQIPFVFDRFYRVDEARSSASGGTGLGLSIVQSIMTLHGGNVAIESQLSEGTRVTLTFPKA